jgi:hypothetical protein
MSSLSNDFLDVEETTHDMPSRSIKAKVEIACLSCTETTTFFAWRIKVRSALVKVIVKSKDRISEFSAKTFQLNQESRDCLFSGSNISAVK